MAKKALLVTFEPTTRIIIDIPDKEMSTVELMEYINENWETVVEAARDNMMKQIDEYLCWDNLTWREDIECP